MSVFSHSNILCLYILYNRYGDERYETRDVQQRVRERFHELSVLDDGVPWKFVNAAQTMDQVENEIWNIAQEISATVAPEARKLWQTGPYELPC